MLLLLLSLVLLEDADSLIINDYTSVVYLELSVIYGSYLLARAFISLLDDFSFIARRGWLFPLFIGCSRFVRIYIFCSYCDMVLV